MDETWFYRIARLTVAPTLRALVRARIQGADQVPRSGPVIIASNHRSFFDSLILPAATPRPITFLAKAEYFSGRGLQGRINRVFFTAAGTIPVDRDEARAAHRSLEIALGVLSRDGAFGIYPEGTRSRDGRLYNFHAGVGHLVLESKAPVVPVAIRGTEKIQPPGSHYMRPAQVSVSYGAPMYLAEKYVGVPPGKARRQIADDILTAVHAMSDQELAGEYNDRAG